MLILPEIGRFLLPAALAGAISWLVSSQLRRLALRRGLMTAPRERDLHRQPIPRLGGVGLILAFVVVLLLTELLMPRVLWFTNVLPVAIDRQVLGIISGALILLIFGLIDDIKGLSPGRQLLGQILAALCVVGSGVGIEFLTNPFGGAGAVVYLTHPTWQLGTIWGYAVNLSPWSDLLTVIWLVLLMNVMNWFDGIDGLAGGVSIIAAVMLAALSLMVGSPTGIVAMLMILAGAAGGFLVWNWHPARLFMGTAGSTLLGFVLGVAAIIAGGKLATTFIVLGVPILDALWVIATRLRSGQSAFKADRSHLHHRFLDAGLTVRQTVGLMYLLAAIFGAVVLWRNETVTKIELIGILLFVMWLLNRVLPRGRTNV